MLTAHLTPLATANDRAALETEWRQLEAQAEASFFVSWSWIGPWLEMVQAQVPVYLFRATGEDGQVRALALFTARSHRQRRLFTAHTLSLNEVRQPGLNMVIEYNGLLCVPGEERAAWESLFRTLGEGRVRWTELALSGVSESVWQLAQAQGGRLFADVDNAMSPWCAPVTGLADLDAVLGTLSRNRRWQVRRSIKHYEESDGPLVCHEAETLQQALAYFDEMGVLHTKRWNRDGLPGSYANPHWVSFHRDVITRGFPRGEIQLLRVTAGEQVLGLIYSFLWRGRVYMLQTGIAESSDNNQRPGYIAHCLAMALNGAKGMAVYDFLCGDADYKQSLGSKDAPLYWGILRRATWRNRLEDYLISRYRQWKQFRARKTEEVPPASA